MRRLPAALRSVPLWVGGATFGSMLALLVVTEPWLLRHQYAAMAPLGSLGSWPALVALSVLFMVMGAIWSFRRLEHMPGSRWLLGMLIIAFQLMNLRAGPLNLLNVGIVGLTLWWLIDFTLRPDVPRETPLMAHLLILLGVLAIISVIGNEDAGQALRALMMLLPKLAMAWVLLHILHRPQDLRFAVKVLVVTSLAAALLGIAQSTLFVLYSVELHVMEELAPRYIVVFGWPLLRASGMMPNPQAYVYPLMISVLLLTYRFAIDGGGRSRWHPSAWAGIVVLLTAIGLSFARGAWMSVLAVALLIPAVAWPRQALRWFGTLLAVAFVGLWSGAVTSLTSAFGQFTSSSADVRLELLTAGIEVLADHPWRGVGLANFESYSPTFERYPVHSSILQLGTELGVPGLLVFVAILLLPALRALLALRTAVGEAAHLLKGLLLGYFAFLVSIQGDPMAYSEFLFFLVVLVDAAGRILGAQIAPSETSSSHRLLRVSS